MADDRRRSPSDSRRSSRPSIGGRHALAVNSCTAALHLAVERTGPAARRRRARADDDVRRDGGSGALRRGGSDPRRLRSGDGPSSISKPAQRLLTGAQRCRGVFTSFAGIMPVHVGGHMMDVDAVRRLAEAWRLWVVEDAAHAFPAARRSRPHQPWRRCGQGTADVTCFSFYANKTITTGEGGMAVTDRPGSRRSHAADVAARPVARRVGALREPRALGLSDRRGRLQIQPDRHRGGDRRPSARARGSDARAARADRACGIARRSRPSTRSRCRPLPEDCLHAWHLFPILLRLDRLTIDRDQFIEELRRRGVTPSVHWRPLHMHPYYQRTYGYRPSDCPQAAARFARVVSLPIFSAMTPGGDRAGRSPP